MALWKGEVLVLGGTDKALKVQYEGEELWFPFGWIHDDSEVYSKKQVGETGTLVLPEWVAHRKGLLE